MVEVVTFPNIGNLIYNLEENNKIFEIQNLAHMKQYTTQPLLHLDVPLVSIFVSIKNVEILVIDFDALSYDEESSSLVFFLNDEPLCILNDNADLKYRFK